MFNCQKIAFDVGGARLDECHFVLISYQPAESFSRSLSSDHFSSQGDTKFDHVDGPRTVSNLTFQLQYHFHSEIECQLMGGGLARQGIIYI